MKRIFKIIMLTITVTLLVSLLTCCQKFVGSNKKSYDPSVSLSGDVDEVIKCSFVDESDGIKMEAVELEELLSRVSLKHELDGVLVLTHSAKSVYVNAQSIPYYYLVSNASGVVALYSRLEGHTAVCELPLVSVSELVFIAKEPSDNNLKCVYPDKTTVLGLDVMFKVFGFTARTTQAVEDDNYVAVCCNFNSIPITSFLLGHDTVRVKMANGTVIDVNRTSKEQVYWSRGALCLVSDQYQTNPIVEIGYPD